MRADNLIGIAFSDLHLYKFKVRDEDGSRLRWSIKAFREVVKEAQRNKVPLYFNGDLFHTPKDVDNGTLYATANELKKAEEKKVQIIAISGNHDLSEKNGITHHSPSYLKTFWRLLNNFQLLDHFDDPYTPLQTPDVRVWGIPYMNSEKELKQRIKQLKPIAHRWDGYKILMLHSDCPGAIDNSGIRCGETPALGKPGKLDKFFKEWDLVLFGHIHLPQKLSQKCYMIGSPIHQISSDKVQMGYWKIFNDKAPKFYGLVNFPKFRQLAKGEKPDNELDYFIEFEEKREIEEIEKGEFTLDQSRTNLAKKYLKKKGIKDKAKKRALIKVLNAVE